MPKSHINLSLKYPWFLSNLALIAFSLLAISGIILLSISFFLSLPFITLALTIPAIIAISFGSLGLLTALIYFISTTEKPDAIQYIEKPNSKTFRVTYQMFPYLKILGIEAKMNESLEPTIIHRRYKHQARKVHPDHNKSDNANADFVTLKNAYDSILNLAEKQLGLFQADNSFQSRGNPVDVEIHDLQREFKNLGQKVSNYHQNITKFTQGVSTFSHRVDEVHITAKDYKSEAKKYIKKADQHIQRVDQHIQRVDQHIQSMGQRLQSMSQRLAINGTQLQDLNAQSHELKLTETTIEQQLRDNQQALDDLVAQMQRLSNPSEDDVQQLYSTHGFFFNASPNVSEDAPFSFRSFNS